MRQMCSMRVKEEAAAFLAGGKWSNPEPSGLGFEKSCV